MDFSSIWSAVTDAFDFKIKVNAWFLVFIFSFFIGLKKVDKKKKLNSGHYFLMVMVMGFVLGFFAIPGPFDVRTVFAYGIAHAGASMALYEFQKYILPGKDNFFGWGRK